ncbi:MAG: AI-2E family transporter [Gemmatimonadota bacterium]
MAVGPWLYAAAVLGFLGWFLFSIHSILSPFILFLLLLFAVWPLIGQPAYRRLALGSVALLALWVVHTTGLLLAPFILAFIFAYILDPLVDLLEARRVPRWLSVILLALPLLAILALFAFVIVPSVARQVSEFIAQVPSHLSAVERWLEGAREWIISVGIPGLDEKTIPRVRDIDAERIVSYLQVRQSEVASQGFQAVLGLGRGVGAALTVLAYLVLLPVLTYYLLRDWDRVRERVIELIPPAQRDRVVGFAAEYDALLSRYLRGQLLMATIVGTFVALGFTIAQLPYALLLGLIAGVFNLVPYLGFALGLLSAILVAVFSGAILTSLAKVAIVFAVEQVMEGILGPLIVGESVGLHPVWVILALALFSFFLGFVGLLIAVPAAVLLKLLIQVGLRRYRASRVYLRGVGEPEVVDEA